MEECSQMIQEGNVVYQCTIDKEKEDLWMNLLDEKIMYDTLYGTADIFYETSNIEISISRIVALIPIGPIGIKFNICDI
ncbi:hypothetical protein RhiirA1_463984 [Rhizophagus irregularis]|uniref:Uncharacterized protein n=1 Tax=Rhizophagus irregularis TaxID=588596 RepID=A0A2N0RIZ4_9GLOM|nr:hypothetical protein RhiirA1_463984 [Rhizophagus irregularis]